MSDSHAHSRGRRPYFPAFKHHPANLHIDLQEPCGGACSLPAHLGRLTHHPQPITAFHHERIYETIRGNFPMDRYPIPAAWRPHTSSHQPHSRWQIVGKGEERERWNPFLNGTIRSERTISGWFYQSETVVSLKVVWLRLWSAVLSGVRISDLVLETAN